MNVGQMLTGALVIMLGCLCVGAVVGVTWAVTPDALTRKEHWYLRLVLAVGCVSLLAGPAIYGAGLN